MLQPDNAPKSPVHQFKYKVTRCGTVDRLCPPRSAETRPWFSLLLKACPLWEPVWAPGVAAQATVSHGWLLKLAVLRPSAVAVSQACTVGKIPICRATVKTKHFGGKITVAWIG